MTPPALAADTALYFARDGQTELTLSPGDADDKDWEVELRQYRAQDEPQNFIGMVTRQGDHLESVEERDDKTITVRINGAPRGETVFVETAGFQNAAAPDSTFDGTYQRISRDEQIERAKKRYAAADSLLNSTYQEVRSAAGKKAGRLRDGQRDWLRYRDHMAEHGAAEKPQESLSYWETMLTLTTARTEFLSLFNGKDVPKGVAGVYIDGFGGELQLEERNDGFEFDLSVVRGPTFHTGDLSGTARRSGSRFSYKEEVEAGEDRKPAELTFTLFAGHIIEVKARNTSHHHGARAYFDGTYYKTRKSASARPEP